MAQTVFATISGGNQYSLNLTNCTSSFIGVTGHGFGDIALTPNARLWGIEGGILYEINGSTATSTSIDITGTHGVSLVALDDATLLTEYQNNLYGISVATGLSY